MAVVCVEFEKSVGKIKPMHGVGQPPFYGTDYSMISYLKDAGIPYSRLHDVGGPYGGFQYVDIPNIFRDFSRDPCDPEAYDFAFTDLLITALIENGVEPVFRLGVTIENAVAIKAYRIYPPEDFDKWAVVCEQIIRHYTEGWANGFHYTITYWEIWNEPDNDDVLNKNAMWQGTKEQYFALYDITAKHLKNCFPHLKIGGYGSCGFYAIANSYIEAANSSPRFAYFITFFEEFMRYIKEHNSPLDFFSWHSYDSIENNKRYADYARCRLDDMGFTHTETTCNEWNCMPDKRGTMLHAAHNTAMLIMMQSSPLNSAMFYDARLGISIYGGLFHPLERRPYPLYYGFKAFGDLYRLSNQVCTKCDHDGVYVLAATDGEQGGILLVNTGQETDLQLVIHGQEIDSCQVVDEKSCLDTCELPSTLGMNSIYYIKTCAK